MSPPTVTVLLIADYLFLFFFFLVLRRPPRSTLFPTRRSSDLGRAGLAALPRALLRLQRAALPREAARGAWDGAQLHLGQERSEEHTSELQSPDHLVCRLLLEKKKSICSAPICTHACYSRSFYP